MNIFGRVCYYIIEWWFVKFIPWFYKTIRKIDCRVETHLEIDKSNSKLHRIIDLYINKPIKIKKLEIHLTPKDGIN